MAKSSRRKKPAKAQFRRTRSVSTLSNGIDLSTNCASRVDCIKQSGKAFVARYYASPNSRKILTLAEARAISTAGMNIVAVWEDGSPTSNQYFSRNEGVDDGTSAYNMASKIGQPANTPIYFAVDYDATDADISGCINDYFLGVKEGFDAISAGSPVHSIGVYGSGAVCGWLLARNVVSYTWLAQSSGWRGHDDFTSWNIKQHEETTLCTLDIDTDEAIDDYGGFTVS